MIAELCRNIQITVVFPWFQIVHSAQRADAVCVRFFAVLCVGRRFSVFEIVRVRVNCDRRFSTSNAYDRARIIDGTGKTPTRRILEEHLFAQTQSY